MLNTLHGCKFGAWESMRLKMNIVGFGHSLVALFD